jgi:hypothetical protein
VWQDGFFTEGAATGESWPGLSPDYEGVKIVEHPFMPLMRASDALYQGMMGHTSESITDEQPQELTLGVGGRAGRYGVVHRKGARGTRRDVSQIGDAGARRIGKAIKRELAKQIKDVGFIQTETEF